MQKAMNPEPDLTRDLFHNCACWAFFLALLQDRHEDSEYVRKLAYGFYGRELREKNGAIPRA